VIIPFNDKELPMTFTRRLLAALSLSAIAFAAHAHSFKLGELSIGHPYARATAPGQPVGGAYLSISNAGSTGDKLLSASAEVARSVELHEMKMDGDVMRMREIPAIEVPAGKAVELKPGGLHFMLMGLKTPLKQGDKFPLKLKFEKAGEVTVTVNVEGPGASHDMKH
jgi:copper(I)-binding protein